jgi:hypothetical protein
VPVADPLFVLSSALLCFLYGCRKIRAPILIGSMVQAEARRRQCHRAWSDAPRKVSANIGSFAFRLILGFSVWVIT